MLFLHNITYIYYIYITYISWVYILFGLNRILIPMNVPIKISSITWMAITSLEVFCSLNLYLNVINLLSTLV